MPNPNGVTNRNNNPPRKRQLSGLRELVGLLREAEQAGEALDSHFAKLEQNNETIPLDLNDFIHGINNGAKKGEDERRKKIGNIFLLAIAGFLLLSLATLIGRQIQVIKQ